MLKRFAATFCVAALVSALSVFTAGAANADPYGCTEGSWGTGWMALCTHGTGKYRAIAYCNGGYTRNGPIRSIGVMSLAACNVGDRADRGTIQVTEF